jgi:hypothetical protein
MSQINFLMRYDIPDCSYASTSIVQDQRFICARRSSVQSVGEACRITSYIPSARSMAHVANRAFHFDQSGGFMVAPQDYDAHTRYSVSTSPPGHAALDKIRGGHSVKMNYVIISAF